MMVPGGWIVIEQWRDFYHTFHKTRIGTSEFRSFWSERLGKHNDELEHWLTAKGELPKDK